METEKKEVTTTETVENEVVENTTQENEVKKEKTYTRDEVEKIKAHERELIKEQFQREAEARKAEADRLAKMDEDQKKSYELEQAKKEAQSAVSELNAYKLKDEAIKQASSKGIDLELMQTLDYSQETAESIKQKIDIFERTSKKIHEKAIEDYSKEPTPQVGNHIHKEEKTGYEAFEEKYLNN